MNNPELSSHPTQSSTPWPWRPPTSPEGRRRAAESGPRGHAHHADLESPSKKRKGWCKSVCTLMCLVSIAPNLYRVSHSAAGFERVFPTYYKTGDSPFRAKWSCPLSLQSPQVPPEALLRHSSSFRAASSNRVLCRTVIRSRQSSWGITRCLTALWPIRSPLRVVNFED